MYHFYAQKVSIALILTFPHSFTEDPEEVLLKILTGITHTESEYRAYTQLSVFSFTEDPEEVCLP